MESFRVWKRLSTSGYDTNSYGNSGFVFTLPGKFA